MRTRWEYLRVRYRQTTGWGSGGQRWTTTYSIHRPGVDEAEKRNGDDVQSFTLINELGEEGWELVAETVWDTAAVVDTGGWSNVGIPVELVWTFKRQKD